MNPDGSHEATGHDTLVVADDPSIIELIAAILEDEDDVLFALNGKSALEIAAASRPDLILPDGRPVRRNRPGNLLRQARGQGPWRGQRSGHGRPRPEDHPRISADQPAGLTGKATGPLKNLYASLYREPEESFS